MKPLFSRVNATAGSVLIVVMIICLGLVSMTLLFGHSMLIAYRGADNDLAGHQAEQAVEGGARYAEYLMSNTTNAGDLPDPANYQPDMLPVGDANFWFIGTPTATESGTAPVYGLVDEASKLNLNEATQDMLLNLPGMTQELAASIAQWRNSGAADSSTSGGISFSSTPVKNAPFESVQELALLTGTDTSILYGLDTNLNHVLELNEEDGASYQMSTSTDGRNGFGLLEYVTVFTQEPQTRSDGSTRIDIRAQPPSPALQTLLTNSLSSADANRVRAAISSGPRIDSVLEFYNKSGMSETDFEKICGDLRGARIKGLINVNTASQTVLACVPGIGADKAAQLVATRDNRTQPSTGFAWVAPIIADRIKEAGPWLTGRTYQICADVAAVGRHGRGYRRTQFILDSSTGTPRIIYRRNLAPLGWALGEETRQMLALKKDMQ